MSRPELNRLTTVSQVADGSLTQAAAAHILGLSERHLRRLQRRLEAGGAGDLQDRRREMAGAVQLRREIFQISSIARSPVASWSMTGCGSAPNFSMTRAMSMARIWLQTMRLSFVVPAMPLVTGMKSALGRLPEASVSGQTIVVRPPRFAASRWTTTHGRVFRISLPRVGSS